MSEQTIEDDPWEDRKALLHRLYIEEDRTLKDVMSIMAAEYGFKRTKKQYERILRKWQWKKNLTAKEWQFVAHRSRKRAAEGKESELRVQDILIPKTKMKKELARYGYHSTLQRVAPIRPESPATPPGFVLSTPPGSAMTTPIIAQNTISSSIVQSWISSSWESHVISPNIRAVASPVRAFVRRASDSISSVQPFEFFDLLGQATPWHSFMATLEILADALPTPILVITDDPQPFDERSRTVQYGSESGNAIEDVEFIPRPNISRLRNWIDNLTYNMFTDNMLDHFEQYQLATIQKSISCLPPRRRSAPDIDIGSILQIEHRSSQLEFLKLAILSLSNDHLGACPDITPVIMELLQNHRNRALLEDLLARKLHSVDSFAEKLVAPAVEANDWALVTSLLRAGLDVNANGYVKNRRTQDFILRSPLYIAIQHDNEEMVRYLLNHGANSNEKGIYISYAGYMQGVSILEVAVIKGNASIVNELLASRTQFNRGTPRIATKALFYATQLSDTAILEDLATRILSRSCNTDAQNVHILEAAALCGNWSIIEKVLKHGHDLNSADISGLGSPLTAAAYGGHTQLILPLLELGADVDGISAEFDNRFAHYGGLTALQVSLWRGNSDITQLLIANGADPNRRHCIFENDVISTIWPDAIQIAAFFCQNDTVQLLLDAGACLESSPAAWDRSSNIWHNLLRHFERLKHRPAIHIALERGNLDIVSSLLANGATLQYQNYTYDNEGWDALTLSLIGGNEETIQFVLNQDTCHVGNGRALQACIEFDLFDLARNILRTGAGIYSPGSICAAVFKGDEGLVRCLLADMSKRHGTIPPACGAAGIAFAASRCNLPMIRLFLDFGVSPLATNAKRVIAVRKNEEGKPLFRLSEKTNALCEFAHYRAEYWMSQDREPQPILGNPRQQHEMADILLTACGDLSDNISTADKQRSGLVYALCYAAFHGKSWLVEKILCTGIDVNLILDVDTFPTVLHAATEGHRYEIAEYLIEKGANPNVPTSRGTALQLAAQEDNVRLVRLFLEHGAEVNAMSGNLGYATALQYAAMNGNFEIFNVLLEAGGDVNAKRSYDDGRTALEGAAEYGKLDMVRYLLEAGADIRGRENRQYRRAVYRAWKEGHCTIVRMLQEYKLEKYGHEESCSTEEIIGSMTDEELEYEYESDEDETGSLAFEDEAAEIGDEDDSDGVDLYEA